MERALASLCNQNFGLYPKACGSENSSNDAWLLYSAYQQDEVRLAYQLSILTIELLGVKWKQVKTTEVNKKKTQAT